MSVVDVNAEEGGDDDSYPNKLDPNWTLLLNRLYVVDYF